MTTAAQTIVITFGVTIIALCLWGIALPSRLMSVVRGVLGKRWGMPFAVTVRLILGVALLLAASAASYPVSFQVIGWLALLAAAALPVIGRKRLQSMMEWLESLPTLAVRVWLVFGALFGSFLLHGIGEITH